MHTFRKVDDAQTKQIDMVNFIKNMALIGALLMFLLMPRPMADGPRDRVDSCPPNRGDEADAGQRVKSSANPRLRRNGEHDVQQHSDLAAS
jgi:hypothetical protein